MRGGAKVVGFGGLEEVKFRGGVLPGDRLVMVVQLLKVRRGAMIESLKSLVRARKHGDRYGA